MIEVQAKGSWTCGFDHADAIDPNDAASMALKEICRIEVLGQDSQCSVDGEAIGSGHCPDEPVASLEVSNVPDLDHDIGVLAADGEALERHRSREQIRTGGAQVLECSSEALEADRFEEVVGDARIEPTECAIDVRRDDDDLEIGMLLAETVGESEAIGPRHSKVDKGDLRPSIVAESLRIGCESGLTNDFDLLAQSEQKGQLVARKRLVIDHDRPKGHAVPCGKLSHFSSSPVMMRGASRRPSTVRVPVNSITDWSSWTISSRYRRTPSSPARAKV